MPELSTPDQCERIAFNVRHALYQRNYTISKETHRKMLATKGVLARFLMWGDLAVEAIPGFVIRFAAADSSAKLALIVEEFGGEYTC